MSEQKKVFIDRDHFDERVRLAAGPDAEEEFSADFLDGVKVVLHMLSTEPPAEVKPEAKGEWLIVDESYWRGTQSQDKQINRVSLKCSNCGHRITQKDFRGIRNFCPNCGVDMRGKEE